MADQPPHVEIAVVNARLDNMERAVTNLATSVQKIGDALSQQRHPIPFKEIAATVAVCLGIIAYIGNFLETQHNKNTRVLEYRIEQMEKRF